MSYFPLYSESKIEFELDLSNYATCADTLQFPEKDDLSNLKSEVDEIDVDSLAE